MHGALDAGTALLTSAHAPPPPPLPPPMLRLLLLVASAVGGRACDSVAVLPFATADGLGALYGKNADRQYKEAQPVAAMPRMTHPAGAIITLDSGLKIPQVPLTYAHAGSRPNWAHPCASDATPRAVLTRHIMRDTHATHVHTH